MKIAISGKGGVGKTTLAGCLARLLAEQGQRVLAIDADPDSNLPSALGVPPEKLGAVQPLTHLKNLVAERTGAKPGTFGGMFTLNPKVDDLPDAYSVEHLGIKLLTLGSVPLGGGGCLCPEGTLLRSLMRHLMVARGETVIVDMEAGLEHLARGSTEAMDAFLVVVEPGQRSIQTAHQIRRLAADLGVRKVFAVGNKVVDEVDRRVIEEGVAPLPLLGILAHRESIREADRQGVSPYDLDPDLRAEVAAVYQRLLTLTNSP
ncbi:MAG: carbon monoxide dehydrogenase accessory protein CooC [Desulfuromonadales bacterium]|nr:carbon monoxide dehydrogenase accessory protein CooC [Desulfuromonadales bacterium]